MRGVRWWALIVLGGCSTVAAADGDSLGAYHVTNVREDGTIPSPEPPHWQGLNTFRTQAQIVPGGGTLPPGGIVQPGGIVKRAERDSALNRS